MKKIFLHLKENNLVIIAISIIAVTIVCLTTIVSTTNGEFGFCLYKNDTVASASIQIKGKSILPEAKSDRCL